MERDGSMKSRVDPTVTIFGLNTPSGHEMDHPARVTERKELVTYVVASVTDGYEALFSLAELDPAFIANHIIVADTVDGQPIPRDPGPLRLVVPKESRAARSVRMLERLDVVRLRT
jgi:hypothetical protein